MKTERPVPLSALQHYLFCPKQCALIHNEQVWAENRFTAEGQVLHKKANEGPDESRPGIRILRALPVSSEKYNLTGICDIVEARFSGKRFSPQNLQSLTPLEYKRGKPKSHRADEVQVCAQALCLEEMFQIEIERGCIFYGEKRRRTDVPLDATLRTLTVQIIEKTHSLFHSGITPQADYLKARCANCSLLDLCMPKRRDRRVSAANWFQESALT
jgi:CRISPR-associated exonuclease Cas4